MEFNRTRGGAYRSTTSPRAYRGINPGYTSPVGIPSGANWRPRSFAGRRVRYGDTNIPNITRTRAAAVGRAVIRTVGVRVFREMVISSGLPGQIVSIVLNAIENAEPPADPYYDTKRKGAWRYGNKLHGFGMGLLDNDLTLPGTQANALPAKEWPLNTWSFTFGANNYVHQYNNPNTFGTLKRYAYTTSHPLATVGTNVEALNVGAGLPRFRKGHRKAEPRPVRAPTVPLSYMIDITPRSARIVPNKTGRPKPRIKEGKLSPGAARIVNAIRMLVGATTEALDFLDVVYAASGGYDSEAGLGRNPYWGFQERMDWLFFKGGIENFDPERFVQLLAVEQATDKVIGTVNRKIIDKWRDLGKLGPVGPTAGPAL